MKLRSCATLFAQVSPPDSVLDKYFAGEADERTLELMRVARKANMKLFLTVVAVFVALGVWAGFRAGEPPFANTRFQAGLAIAFAAQILFCLWVWFRARPGSADRMVLPPLIVLSASMLVNLLPRLLWPGDERMQFAAMTISTALLVVALVMHIRRRRALRQEGHQ